MSMARRGVPQVVARTHQGRLNAYVAYVLLSLLGLFAMATLF